MRCGITCSRVSVVAIISIQTCALLIYMQYTNLLIQNSLNEKNLQITSGSNGSESLHLQSLQRLTSYSPQKDIIGIEAFRDLISKYSVPKYSYSSLPRIINATEYNTLMRLVQLTSRVLDSYNISHVLSYGSLIGSYFMHDILPWDDDVDIFINNNTKAQVLEIFKDSQHFGIESYHYRKSSGQIIKIFFNSSNHAGGYPWKWPFIDLLSYVEDGDQIIAVERAKKARINVPKDSFFPFHKRPYGPLWLNAPKDPVTFFKAKYGQFSCKSGAWNHKQEKGRKRKSVESCSALRKYYPFVKRTKSANRTMESLTLDGKQLYEIEIDEEFRNSSSMYGW